MAVKNLKKDYFGRLKAVGKFTKEDELKDRDRLKKQKEKKESQL